MVLASLLRRVVVPCALLSGATYAYAESAVLPDVPGQPFPDTGYIDDPDTGPSGGVDTGGARPPPVDTGVPGEPDAEPAAPDAEPAAPDAEPAAIDAGALLDAAGVDAEGASALPDGFLGPPELPEEPSSCAAVGPRGGAAAWLALTLGVVVRRRAGRRRS